MEIEERAMTEKTEKNGGIRAVILDYGEVLCHRAPEEEWLRMAGVFAADGKTFPAMWEKNRPAFDRGDLSAKEYWATVAKDAGVELDETRMAEVCAWDVEMWGRANEEMVGWLRRLRRAGIRTGLLSNMHYDMIGHLRKNFEWLDQFDFMTFSADVRMVKPDAAIYVHTLRGLGVEAGETLFVDDREVNVRAARELGIRAVRFTSLDRLREELKGMGFGVLP